MNCFQCLRHQDLCVTRKNFCHGIVHVQSHDKSFCASHTNLSAVQSEKNYSSLISYPIMLKQHRSCSFIFKENFCLIKISKIPHLNKETAYSYSCSASALQQIIKNYNDRGYTDCLPRSIMLPETQNNF